MAVMISIKRLNQSQATLFYMNPSLQHKLDSQPTSWSTVTNYSGPQQGRAAPVCTLHRFVGQACVGSPRFQSDWSKTFIERVLGHLIEIHVAQ